MQKSFKLLFIFLLLSCFFLYNSLSEETTAPSSEEKSEENTLPEPQDQEVKKEIDPERVELNKDTKKRKPREYEAEDDEDEFEAKKKKEKEREKRRRKRYDDDYDDEEEEEDEEYERNSKPKSRKEREPEPDRDRERERMRRDRERERERRERMDDYDDPEEYFDRSRGGRDRRPPPPPPRRRPDIDREERMRDRDRHRRPPMDDSPPEYRRRRDRRDDVDREKHFDEMKRRMQDRENSGDHYKTDKAEKQQPVISKYSIIIWGEEHPFLSHWISQVANMAPENGVLANDWMRREASHISINVDDFKNQGVDLSTELLYTGFIEYEQRLKDYDIHITNKFVPYIACRPTARRVLEEEKPKEEKKSDL